MQYFLDFRAPGGFKDSNWAFTVDNEQFTTPDGDIVELYSREATQKYSLWEIRSVAPFGSRIFLIVSYVATMFTLTVYVM